MYKSQSVVDDLQKPDGEIVSLFERRDRTTDETRGYFIKTLEAYYMPIYEEAVIQRTNDHALKQVRVSVENTIDDLLAECGDKKAEHILDEALSFLMFADMPDVVQIAAGVSLEHSGVAKRVVMFEEKNPDH